MAKKKQTRALARIFNLMVSHGLTIVHLKGQKTHLNSSTETLVLATIKHLMRQNDLSYEDIEQYYKLHQYPVGPEKLTDMFDVLVETPDRNVPGYINTKRVLFSLRSRGKPIGIFPFKGSDFYIELTEVENKTYADLDNVLERPHLPDVTFLRGIAKLVAHLNLYLQSLNSPPLEGEYLVSRTNEDENEAEKIYWVYSFDNKCLINAGADQPTKLRLVKDFGGSRQTK